jgi:hypothetical protein
MTHAGEKPVNVHGPFQKHEFWRAGNQLCAVLSRCGGECNGIGDGIRCLDVSSPQGQLPFHRYNLHRGQDCIQALQPSPPVEGEAQAGTWWAGDANPQVL